MESSVSSAKVAVVIAPDSSMSFSKLSISRVFKSLIQSSLLDKKRH